MAAAVDFHNIIILPDGIEGKKKISVSHGETEILHCVQFLMAVFVISIQKPAAERDAAATAGGERPAENRKNTGYPLFLLRVFLYNDKLKWNRS